MERLETCEVEHHYNRGPGKKPLTISYKLETSYRLHLVLLLYQIVHASKPLAAPTLYPERDIQTVMHEAEQGYNKEWKSATF